MRTAPQNRLLIEWCVLTLLLIALALLASSAPKQSPSGGLLRVDVLLYDALQRAVRVRASDALVVIEIDDTSLARIGRWPWPRSVHARMLQQLEAAGVSSVGLDLLLTEPSELDVALGNAVRIWTAAGRKFVLPVTESSEPAGVPGPLYPVPEFGRLATLAHARFRVDVDGSVRGLYLSEAGFPAFALALSATRSIHPAVVRARAESTQTRRDEAVAQGRWDPLAYVMVPRLTGRIHSLSYADVLLGQVDRARLQGRVVMIGATAQGLGDRYASGMIDQGRLAAGIELHAATFAALERGRLVVPLERTSSAIVTAAAVLLLMIALYRLGPRLGLLATFGAGALVMVLSALAVFNGNWFAPAGTLVALALAYPLWSWRRLEIAVGVLRNQAQALDREGPILVRREVQPQPAEPIARSLFSLSDAASRALSLRRFLEMTLQNLPHPAFVADTRGQFLFTNQKLALAFGAAPAAGEDAMQWFAARAGLALDATPAGGAQLERRDGAGRDWLIDTHVFSDAQWSDATLVQLVDITPIRSAQREREQTLRFLSHDLRAPQVSILAIIERLKREGRHEPWIAQVEHQAQAALALANGFVQLTRAELQPLTPAVIDLADSVTEAIDACWHVAQQAGVTLTSPGVREGALVWADPQLMRRALINLLDNAIKFSPVGGTVEVSLSALPGGPDAPARWQLSVADLGPGITEQDLEKVFEPFWRGPDAARRPGAGLGLTFVKVVADRHGAQLRARQRQPQGAEFLLTIAASSGTIADEIPATGVQSQ